MRIAHLILTYTDPKQTERLIKRLVHEQCDIYVHVDKKVDIATHELLLKQPHVYFIKNRTDVRWAGYNTVKATFRCLQEIADTGIHYDYVNFLSGQDYPIKSNEYLFDFLSRNAGKQFIAYKDFETEWQEALRRTNRYHLVNFRFKGKYKLEELINQVLSRGKFPGNLRLYGSGMFWTLTMDCAMYVVNYVQNNPKLQRFLHFTWGSDEFIFQTILMNSRYKDQIVNNHYRYIDWSAGGAHPKVLTMADYDKLKASHMLFARKFNTTIDEKILDKLDTLIMSQEAVS
ncbi:MAG TPA: beta-1,6-N-acetylglucosaminyltransferase [Chitinophaga sp.]|uniref:beta-1,6-N-acetylglucosaminyltransferase n=1 Tax=Chitinophaga sp. TaxID=1869181 RepID=UPI002BF72B15|nr:beta-1,6-N-acetylglucosaminyltransferase [Chitinophaga sp.]HVI43447.1 beta-1,6-N-acetylglucosaminyltransferase [Chitinophaga sp.]